MNNITEILKNPVVESIICSSDKCKLVCCTNIATKAVTFKVSGIDSESEHPSLSYAYSLYNLIS